MVRAWQNTGKSGAVGMLHPDTHFSGPREGALRAAAYKRLRSTAISLMRCSDSFPPGE